MNYIQGDLIDLFEKGIFNSIAHQCNLVGGVGGFHGVLAKKFIDLYEVAENYKNRTYMFGKCLKINIKVNGKYTGQNIINLYSQYYLGSPNNKFIPNTFIQDNFDTRLKALSKAMEACKKEVIQLQGWNPKLELNKVGIPLLSSGLASDSNLKRGMTDLQYFQKYIAPVISPFNDEQFKITVVYL